MLIAAQNEASIWVSSPPKVARNTLAEPVHFGTAIAVLKSFSQYFRLAYCLKSFRGTISEM
jgi:hypothetical protein